MNSEGYGRVATGEVESSDTNLRLHPEHLPAAENMKRAAAKQLIEKLYFQLMEGCGNGECINEQCATGRKSVLTSNDAAAQALMLVRSSQAKLCGIRPVKVARQGTDLQSPSTSSQEEPLNVILRAPGKSMKKVDFMVDGQGRPWTWVMGEHTDDRSVEQILEEEEHSKAIPFLTEESMYEVLQRCEQQNNYSELIRTIGHVFSDPAVLNRSFLLPVAPPKPDDACSETPLCKEEKRALEGDQDKDTDSTQVMEDADCAGAAASDAAATAADAVAAETTDAVAVDVAAVRRVYARLFAIAGLPFQDSLINAMTSLAQTLRFEAKYNGTALERAGTHALHAFIVLMEIPELHSTEYLKAALPELCRAAGELSVGARAQLARAWSTYDAARLHTMAATLQQLLTVRIVDAQCARGYAVADDDTVQAAAKLLKVVFYASLVSGRFSPAEQVAAERALERADDESMADFFQGAMAPKEAKAPAEDALARALSVHVVDCLAPAVAHAHFQNDVLSDQLEADRSFHDRFAVDFPFLLTIQAKVQGMHFEHRLRMYHERRFSVLQALVHDAPPNPYLRLRVRRDNIIDDALVRLEMIVMENPADLKKQLYVEFDGEQGIDEGGVSKEFFQLVVDSLFNPDFAMFTCDPDTHMVWFNPTSFETDRQFTLIGIVLGLAIYNNVILDVHFPMVVYRKLMGKLGTFDDLKDSHPTLARSLQELLDYEGDDVEDVFMQTFRVSYTDVFGANLTQHLKPDGDKIPVTKDNRQEFVELYADFLLNKMAARQFRAFKTGFQMVTDESPLKVLFRPEELEVLVCGSKDFDFNALEETTEYDNGYSKHHSTIRHFWEIVHEMAEEQKKSLLMFATGSDRVPAGGLAKLKMIIARHGPDTDRLPTAHTCFNVLLLPEYSNKEKLKDRLLKAISYAKGFGML
ncbi:PREDICTED: ubiquitin-protein ligase E3A-like [Priapulus caudatus]|uniref:HECT-type E3 ubiquitin transferase n=1 Tax=Priapulus caudatus TaxID=37621 RepID=A0ABM1EWJ9_PRICU|nr:PREDICTED: ubiquitin-protein ligase E3A-like [Priapulus caudatus]